MFSISMFMHICVFNIHFEVNPNKVFCTPMQMGVASVVHLYVFPAKPYELMDDRFVGDVSVLGDYASVDCPLDPDEVKDSERPTKLRLPQPDDHVRCSTAIKESVRDVVLGGGEYVRKQFATTFISLLELCSPPKPMLIKPKYLI